MGSTKPIILVDMDGPLADFDHAIWEVITESGVSISCTKETQTVRFIDDAVAKEDRHIIRTPIDTAGWFRNLPITPGAQEGMEALDKIADVYICTKPLEKNKTCRDDKAAWVEEHLGHKWVDRLFIAPDKSLVHGAILLDDAPKPKWYSRALWLPVIFPTPWNGTGSLWEGLPRWTWGDDPEELLAIAYGGHLGKPDFEDVAFPLFEKV